MIARVERLHFAGVSASHGGPVKGGDRGDAVRAGRKRLEK
jgi:hypothetical protein